MRKNSLPLLLMTLSLASFASYANDIEPGKEIYTVIKAPSPIVLDGNLSEWSGVPVLADPKFSIPKGSGSGGTYVLFEEYAGGTWTGPDDQTSAVQVTYDVDNVYFGFVVTDDYHENSANSAWNGDSIQLMIASADRTAQVALYNYALGGIESALGSVIVMHEAGPGGTEAFVSRNIATKRTTYEIKLPKASLGLADLTGGTQFGLGMAINDGDQLTPGQRGWGGLGAHSIVFGKTPAQTALMTLAAPLPPSNDIEPGKETYSVTYAPKPVVLDGSLAEWTGVPILADPKFSIPKGSGSAGTYVLFEEYAGGTWTGPDDQTSAVQVTYDVDNVYFGFVVTDDYHENSANSAWNGDSIQLMIASADRTAQVALYNYALGGIESALGSVIVMHEAGPGGTEAVVSRNITTKRTTYEIKLPKASLGLADLTTGTRFGLGMAINDGDQATPGQRGWGGLGAHSIVFGKTPSQTALMTLAAPPLPPTNDIEPGKEYYTVTRRPNPVVLDGNLSEWSGVPILADPKFSIPKGSGSAGTYVLFEEYAGGTWTGPDDQTSAVQVTYDVDNVYFGFVVTDDYHENAANSAWNGDSIQLMIASADRTAQVALYNYALGGIESALGSVIVMHEAGPGGTEAFVSRNIATKRTTYEIKLPKASLGLTALTGGTQFGLGMAINDGDQLTPGQRGWGGLGAHSIVFGKTPAQTAQMTLAAPLPPSNDIEPGKETYSVTYAPKPVVLDGSLAEWTGVPVLADPKFSIPKGSGSAGTYVLFEEYAGGTWTGPDDQTSAVQVTYDVDNVYFGFVVTDDYHENSANSAWNGDSIQLMIASADRTAQVALYNYALGGIETALGATTIVMHEAGPGGTEAVVSRNTTTKRTTYEIKLPKASLGLTDLTTGTRFGLGMAINDGDQLTPGQRGWGGLGAHSIVFGKTPAQTALMTLAAPPLPPTNDIEPGKEYYTVTRRPNPVVLDGNLSEWSGVPILADPKFSIPKGSGSAGTYVLFEEYAGGTWTGPDDQTSAVQVTYDVDNVYFGFVVTDDYHENAANSAWNGDSIQLMIASADRTAQVALYNYALGGIESALGSVIVMHEAGPGGTEAFVSRNIATKRTTYEIKLPKASLGLTALTGGTQFGLGMAINDGDQLTPGQRGWGGLGAHSIVFGKTPAQTALMTLATYNDIELGKDKYTATAAPNGIAVDGSLSEWVGVPVLADPKFSIPKGSGADGSGTYVLFEEYAGGTWTGPDDQTSAVQIVYDAQNVYFGFVVTDDYHENSANSAWNGDSIQLMIASADRTAQVALYNYALGGIETALGTTIVMHEAGPGGTTAVVSRDTLNNKTIYEIKLPVASLGLVAPLTLGTQFGLGMAINDGDELTPGQRGWGGLGAHSIVFGKTPSQTALITLGNAGSGTATFFLSAINPAVDKFSFRANDVGASIVAPATAKLRIDGQLVALVASPKVLDATDFTYIPNPPPFAAGSHTYSLEVKDTQGNIVTDSGSFVTPLNPYPILTPAHRAVSVDTTKPGFIWRVFQNSLVNDVRPTTLAQAELELAGLALTEFGDPLDNQASPDSIGIASGPGTLEGSLVTSLVKFEIPTVINLSKIGGELNGGFTPDDQMPGIPGTFGGSDGTDAEIITFVELPAGVTTFGVTSDDGFRMQAGNVSGPSTGLLLAESEIASTTTFRFLVQYAGIYPIRTIWQDSAADDFAHVELFTLKADGSRVLLNDTANGGLRTYRVGVAPSDLNIKIVGGQRIISWSEPGTMLQESTDLINWTDLVTATSPYTSVPGARRAVFHRLKK